ncbi:G-protein coupled receptor 55-like [Scyliorhinus canicula]|uniref:G-protein coupled receptor 55-like n=1 Tax=Scyliorhinus canicula TaxID=7830 RepID=UPI0018F4825E|nr:G-protein coupled receptor 55-like [Scyliorhinus canicula]
MANMCNLSTAPLNQSDFVKTFQYVVHIPTFILGLIINLAALWLLCNRLKKWMESTIYMTNLIVCDMFLLFSLPFKIHADKEGGKWHGGPIFCKFVESLYFVNTYGTILLIMLISLDRYIAIKHPFLARTLRSPKKAIIACIVMWVCIWSASIPNYIQSDGITDYCFTHFGQFWKTGIIPLTMEIIFLISATTVMFCSVQIIRTLQRVDEERDDMNMRTSMNVVYSNLATFLLCFTPYHVAMLLYLLAKQCFITEAYLAPLRIFLQISQCWATMNCCLDGLYYYSIIKEFWNTKVKRADRLQNSPGDHVPGSKYDRLCWPVYSKEMEDCAYCQ